MLYDMNFTLPGGQQHSCSLFGADESGLEKRMLSASAALVPELSSDASACPCHSGRRGRHLSARAMLRDLDRLMRERAIDAVVVPMHEAMHSSFRWLSRGAKVTRGYAVKLLDRAPVLVTYPMEREEALATGLEVRLAHEFSTRPDDYEEL